jgi:hypothetical protein
MRCTILGAATGAFAEFPGESMTMTEAGDITRNQRTEHHIRYDAVSRKRMKHPDLNDAKTAATRKDESCLWLGSIAQYRQ